jgi:hypothetical protein
LGNWNEGPHEPLFLDYFGALGGQTTKVERVSWSKGATDTRAAAHPIYDTLVRRSRSRVTAATMMMPMMMS